MKNEDFLLKLIQGCVQGMEVNIQCLSNLPENSEMPAFDDGKIVGYATAKNSVLAALRIYDRYLKGELPEEMEEQIINERTCLDKQRTSEEVLAYASRT